LVIGKYIFYVLAVPVTDATVTVTPEKIAVAVVSHVPTDSYVMSNKPLPRQDDGMLAPVIIP
jgi:hypothetical protein